LFDGTSEIAEGSFPADGHLIGGASQPPANDLWQSPLVDLSEPGKSFRPAAIDAQY
jgi:hypothetical protein